MIQVLTVAPLAEGHRRCGMRGPQPIEHSPPQVVA
jgi:hypothetical protein